MSEAMVHRGGGGGIEVVTFTVPGEPAPQGSKKWVGRMVEDNPKTAPWRERVERRAAECMNGTDPLLGPVEVQLDFYFQRPQSHFGTGRNEGRLKPNAAAYKKTYPDIDKLCRAVFDGLVAGGVLRDDGQVAVLTTAKKYASSPGVRVVVRPLVR